MFMTLLVLYRTVAYMLGHLWRLISAPQLPSGLPALFVTCSSMSRQHLIVDVVMYICTLVLFFIVARSVLVGKKVPANRARSYHTLLKETNETMEMARKAIEQARDDLKEIEETSVVTAEALLELAKVGKNARGIHATLEEMADMLDQRINRRRHFWGNPIHSAEVLRQR